MVVAHGVCQKVVHYTSTKFLVWEFGKLIHEGFNMSREACVPLLLSGVFPNAAPAYLHLRFQRLEGYGDLMIWWPEGIAKGTVKGGRLVYQWKQKNLV